MRRGPSTDSRALTEAKRELRLYYLPNIIQFLKLAISANFFLSMKRRRKYKSNDDDIV